MKQLRLPIFTSKIKYYNLRIIPPDPIFDEVTALKKQFESSYGKQPLSGSKPHISIVSFKMNSKHQDFLIEVFERLSQKEAFELTLDGFGVFEKSNTLYLKVSKSSAIEAIHREIEFLQDNYLKGKLKSFTIVDDPHMTISKTTGKKMLYDSLQYFQENDFSKQIEINQLTLVSRSKYKTWDWQHAIRLS
ncbi:2'-5' RNA ligase family protein [Allomuricauda sp. SCSIO 65647]|uniref:2'-5' RNA ligase family protein n=1 Tax=Allomuricauda sp. SCSIO 65647 TaxID=2908843 RepID=UPI001F1E8655|nr:2'-5' RNA ligase family protein [Muricauda sp. SCSIO 65647]UJH67354.1 2'-5' RNA ligase family protein [Muricauda sp. SCSIO 65647]